MEPTSYYLGKRADLLSLMGEQARRVNNREESERLMLKARVYRERACQLPIESSACPACGIEQEN